MKPKSREECEIALAMKYAHQLAKEIQSLHPDLPLNAISVGLINSGIQLGVTGNGPAVVADYLTGCAMKITEGSLN